MTVVLFSGGVGSWATARRLLDRGTDPADMTLLFTDTLIEDEDLYVFLDAAAAQLGVPLTRIADGRTPWEVFYDRRFLGNTRVDLCSRILKRELAREWIDERWPDGTTVALGIDWSEVHRADRARPQWEPHQLVAPLCDPPYLDKEQMLAAADDAGLPIPRLYRWGFTHNNCGGFCVKQGQAGFLQLLVHLPDRYAWHEAEEQRLRDHLDKDVAILRDRTGGTTTPLTLRELRERHKAKPQQLELLDDATCAQCMV